MSADEEDQGELYEVIYKGTSKMFRARSPKEAILKVHTECGVPVGAYHILSMRFGNSSFENEGE